MPISVLGVLTIIGYGACYYAYGVLIGPMSADTRWPDAALGAVFSATLVITGAGGIVAGRVLDRRGPRPVFLLAGIAGAGAMILASVQGALLPFAMPTPAAAAWSGRSASTTSPRPEFRVIRLG